MCVRINVLKYLESDLQDVECVLIVSETNVVVHKECIEKARHMTGGPLLCSILSRIL
jgi:hypothetical protein